MRGLREQECTLLGLLESLRSTRQMVRRDPALAAWEEQAVLQRHKLQQAVAVNMQLKCALFQQRGFLAGLKNVFTDALPFNSVRTRRRP